MVDRLRLRIEKAAALWNRPNDYAGRAHTDESLSGYSDLNAIIVVPRSAVIIAVGVHQVVICYEIGGLSPAPRHVQPAVIVILDSVQICIDVAHRSIDVLAELRPTAGRAVVLVKVAVAIAGRANPNFILELPFRCGKKARIGDGAEADSAEVIFHRPELGRVPLVQFGIARQIWDRFTVVERPGMCVE